MARRSHDAGQTLASGLSLSVASEAVRGRRWSSPSLGGA